MRQVLLPAAILALSVACGASKLTQKEASKDLAVDYPVVVTTDFPQRASAVKGSPEHAKLLALEAALKPLPFRVTRKVEGDRELFLIETAPGAPATVQTGAKGFEVPVAKAEFVKATKLETLGTRARVTYQIRLAQPTEFFPIFQITHPKAQVGATQDRQAEYVKEGSKWILDRTNERYKKAR